MPVTTRLESPPPAPDDSPDGSDRLFSAALAIVSARTVDDMLRETTARAAEFIGARQAMTSLTVDRDRTRPLTATHWSGTDARFGPDVHAEALSGMAAEVCRTNRPLRLRQAQLERRSDWRESLAANGDAPPLRGFLGVPLIGHEGRNLGLIQLSDRIDGEFDADDERLLTSFAQFTAMAIEQLRLHADLDYQSRLTLTVTENATSGLFLMDRQLRVTYMNSAAREITGHSLAGLDGRSFHEVVHHSRPDGTRLPIEECRIWQAVIGEQAVLDPFEDWFIRPDGTFYPVRIAAAPIKRDDRVESVVLELQDITSERAVARRLRDLALSASDRAAKLRGLIESIGDPVVVSDRDGAVSLANPAAVEIFGPNLVDVGQVRDRLRRDDGSRIPADADMAGSYLLAGASRETWFEVRPFAVPIGATGHVDDDGGEAGDHGRIYVLRDVTASRHARVLRETFIGMLSHELRTPITTVYGGAKVLARHTDGIQSEVRSIVADIENEAERLYRLVEDLVVLTKSEAATLDAGGEPILLQRILPRLVAAEAHRWPTLEFDVHCTLDLPPVLAEQTYVEQVVRNLLTNAAKYGGAEGRVEVRGELDGDEVVVRVLDRGPGFPEGDASRLFDIYYRSPQVARRAAGAGIGLFVSKALVDAMDGRIWAAERDGGGAEFGFALSALTEPGDQVPGHSSTRGKGREVDRDGPPLRQ
jgi:PAS domain S-box-containing protein